MLWNEICVLTVCQNTNFTPASCPCDGNSLALFSTTMVQEVSSNFLNHILLLWIQQIAFTNSHEGFFFCSSFVECWIMQGHCCLASCGSKRETEKLHYRLPSPVSPSAGGLLCWVDVPVELWAFVEGCISGFQHPFSLTFDLNPWS